MRKGKRLAWNKIPRFFLTDDLAVGEVTNMFLKLSIVHLKLHKKFSAVIVWNGGFSLSGSFSGQYRGHFGA